MCGSRELCLMKYGTVCDAMCVQYHGKMLVRCPGQGVDGGGGGSCCLDGLRQWSSMCVPWGASCSSF